MGVRCPTVSEVLSKATPGLFKKTSPSTFFTMLAFSQILNIYLQWLAALSQAVVFMVTLKKANLWFFIWSV